MTVFFNRRFNINDNENDSVDDNGDNNVNLMKDLIGILIKNQ